MPPETDLHHPLGGKRRSRVLMATIAMRQHGVICREQLRRIGFSDREIDRMIEARRLHQVHRGVYAVGHRRLSREGRFMAAVLFAGDGAVLSHCCAADLWELRASSDLGIDVTAPTDRRGDRIVRIRRHALQPGDATTRLGIPVTTPLRTLLGLAAVVPQKELERAIRQAVYRRLTTTALLADAVHERAGRRGNRAMRQTLIHLGEAPGLQRSDLEADFAAFLRRHRLPPPELNVALRVAGGRIEADCLWREQRLIVELDGRDAHDSTPAFESDRERDLALLAAGWRVARITAKRLRADGRLLGAQLRAALA